MGPARQNPPPEFPKEPLPLAHATRKPARPKFPDAWKHLRPAEVPPAPAAAAAAEAPAATPAAARAP